MKKTTLLTSLFALAALVSFVPLKAMADSHAKMTVEEFLKLPADQRLSVCAKLADSTEIGQCMNFKHSSKPAAHVSSERIELEMMRCAKDTGSGSEVDLAQCARERLNSSTHASHHFTDAQMAAAEKVCIMKGVASLDAGACMSAVLPHIDAKGNYH